MATADYLAERLSKKTGTHFEVLRGRIPNERGVGSVMRYGLRATRGEWSHTFQASRPMKLSELTRWLASLCDMVEMGFIPMGSRPGIEPGSLGPTPSDLPLA